jgi:flagellar hook-basal body protein
VEPIRVPSVGDFLAGERTTEAALNGVLPSNTETDDFDGSETGSLELMGNLTGESSIETSIYVAMTETDGSSSSTLDEIREVKVRIDFSGGTPNGDMNDFSWTMTTVDWPEPGSPGVQIYPPTGDEAFTQGTVSFYNQGNAETETGLGEPVEAGIEPGPGGASVETTDADGNRITTSFRMPQGFTLDVAHMTSMANPPVAQGLGTWFVDGNPTGTMRRTVMVFDEVASFDPVTNEAGVTTMEASRRMESRENSLIFTPGVGRDDGSDWTWTSSTGGDSGSLSFNTDGDLVSSAQTGGAITYDFSEVGTAGQAGTLRLASQDGFRDGILQEVTIDNNGKIWGRYSNELNEQLAQIAVATVPNNNGLSKVGGNLFYPAPEISGDVQIDGANGMNGSGRIMSRSLEGSNVQLAQEFTNMISIERGYQFNSRVVTTSDEMLQTALQLIP